MSDYKLVPVELLKDWHERINTIAAETAFNVADEMESMLAAAPAVQGEPVYLYRRRGLHDFVTCNHDRYAELSAKPRLFETKVLYTAPQPAEQQPTPDVPGLTEAMRQYQHNDGSGFVFAYDRILVDQYVAGLVEALELALEYWRDRQQRYKNRRPKWVIAAESALAAHRKQKENK